jgi:hypothetical protein
MIKLSNSERSLLSFARAEFGEHLTQFLLAGLGEEKVGQRWRFTITYADSNGPTLKRLVQVITHEPMDGSSLLPCGRDPLVLLALLHLLLNSDHASSNSLEYRQEDVLSILGWRDTRKARREIDEAIKRYFMLSYKWKMNKSEMARQRLSFYTSNEGLISESNFLNEEDANAGQMKRIFNRVVFNEHFIEQLLNQSLFGIDWSNVRSVSLKFPSRK